MHNRRDFLKSIAVAAAGAGVAGRFTYDVLAQAAQGAAGGRRQISIGGKRIKVIDAHAHLSIRAVADVVKGTPFERNGNGAANQVIGPERIKAMDALGIDMAVLTQQGAWWYGVPDRDLARVDRQDDERRHGRGREAVSRIDSSAWRRFRCSFPTSPPRRSRTASSGSV